MIDGVSRWFDLRWAHANEVRLAIKPEDLGEAVRFLLRTSPACIVPEIKFIRPGDTAGAP